LASPEVIRKPGWAIVEGVCNIIGHMALNVPVSSSNWGVNRVNQPPNPMIWMHIDADGRVQGVVQKSTKTVDNKLDRQCKLTIVDPLDNIEEVQADLNVIAIIVECLAELDDGGGDIVDDFGSDMRYAMALNHTNMMNRWY
jgi:hypothetical protein